MSDEISIPHIGPVPRVLLVRWFVPDGATVAVNEPLCEIETDKATLDLQAHKAWTNP